MRAKSIVAVTMTVLIVGCLAAWADKPSAQEQAELARAVGYTKLTLETGIRASERSGKPISAKFEIEHGNLQLSVYTEKNGKFSEVVLEPKTGKVIKTEAITEGGDLADAQRQSKAMAHTRRSLLQIVSRAVQANPGSRAVSVNPGADGTGSRAEVELLRQHILKTVAVGLE